MYLNEDYEGLLCGPVEPNTNRTLNEEQEHDGDFKLDLNLPYTESMTEQKTREVESGIRENIQCTFGEDKSNISSTKRRAPFIQQSPSSKILKANHPTKTSTQLRTLPPPPDPARRLFRGSLPITTATNTTKATGVSLPPAQAFSSKIGKGTPRREEGEIILIDLSIEPEENLRKDQQNEHTRVDARKESLRTKMGRRKSYSESSGVIDLIESEQMERSTDLFPDVQDMRSPSNKREEMNEFLEFAVLS